MTTNFGLRNLNNHCNVWWKTYVHILNHFEVVHESDRQTDRNVSMLKFYMEKHVHWIILNVTDCYAMAEAHNNQCINIQKHWRKLIYQTLLTDTLSEQNADNNKAKLLIQASLKSSFASEVKESLEMVITLWTSKGNSCCRRVLVKLHISNLSTTRPPGVLQKHGKIVLGEWLWNIAYNNCRSSCGSCIIVITFIILILTAVTASIIIIIVIKRMSWFNNTKRMVGKVHFTEFQQAFSNWNQTQSTTMQRLIRQRTIITNYGNKYTKWIRTVTKYYSFN